MNGNCHFIFGASVGCAMALNLDTIHNLLPNIADTPETMTLFILGGLIGGIFPDIDNPNSYMGKLSVPVSSFIGKISEFFGKKGVHHRGLLHDPAVYIAGIVLSYLYIPSLVGFFIGCFSHLFLDMLNPSGIPFLLGSIKLHLANIRSGSKAGTLVTWASSVSAVVIGLAIRTGDFFGKM